MNVVLNTPISISVNVAKLIIESDGRSTIEFSVLDQPVRLNIDSTDYVYDINIAINDRVILIEAFGALAVNSTGIVKEIIPDRTQDRVKIWFDQVYPNQFLKNVEANVEANIVSLMVELPLAKVEKTS